MAEQAGLVPPSGLSCYSAALHAYLAREWDADAVVARSIRFAVGEIARPLSEPLPYSHHKPATDRLPDGSRLVYSGGGSDLAGVRAELARWGRALVVADAAALPWSVTRGMAPRPHWLVVDDVEGGRWHVDDPFRASVPGFGDQEPFRGWLDEANLLAATARSPVRDPATAMRETMAFGRALTVPDQGPVWLSREHAATKGNGGESGTGSDRGEGCGTGWVAGAAALRAVATRFVAENPDPFNQLDDLWAVAGHQVFLLRHVLSRDHGSDPDDPRRVALQSWLALPRLVRVAFESHQRGRSRLTLVKTALRRLAELPETRV